MLYILVGNVSYEFFCYQEDFLGSVYHHLLGFQLLFASLWKFLNLVNQGVAESGTNSGLLLILKSEAGF